MAFSTYAQLIDSVRAWSRRTDATDALIADFILLAEKHMFANPVETLNIEQMDTRATALTVDGDRFFPLPEQFMRMRRLWFFTSGGNKKVSFVTPNRLDVITTAGRPRFFTVTSQLGFDRVPDQIYTIEMQYFAKPPALSTANITNIVLDNFPGIYINGALWNLWKYYHEEDLADKFYTEYMKEITGANFEDSQARYGPNPETTLANAGAFP